MNLISNDHKIVIFGSTGMVGNAILRCFRKSGYKKILLPLRKDLDLLNGEAVKKWFNQNKPEIVIVAAAKVGGIYANNKYPADFILKNLKIQTNIIETSFENGIKKLLFLGSSCIYPKYSSQPIKEEELLKGSLEPTNQWYAIAKIAGIKLCEALYKQYNFNAISLMPTNLYGPGDNYDLENSHVIASLIRRFYEAKINNQKEVICWGSGNPLREFLHVYDLAEACTFVLEKWDPRNIIESSSINNQVCWLNVGSENEISIKDLAKLISNSVGYEGEIIWDKTKPDGTPRKKLETSRLNNLGWFPKIDFKKGIKDTIEDYKKGRINEDNRL